MLQLDGNRIDEFCSLYVCSDDCQLTFNLSQQNIEPQAKITLSSRMLHRPILLIQETFKKRSYIAKQIKKIERKLSIYVPTLSLCWTFLNSGM